MDPLAPHAPPDPLDSPAAPDPSSPVQSPLFALEGPRLRSSWVFFGPQGMRAGWSLVLFWALYKFLLYFFGTIAVLLDPALENFQFSASNAVIGEIVPLLAILVGGYFLALLEQRRLLDYNLRGPRPLAHAVSGALVGFGALSVLVAALAAGGWLHFGPTARFGAPLVRFCLLWGLAFLLTGLFEEGAFRCYAQFTLTRGLNFWWALAAQALLCLDLAFRVGGVSVYG
ncbi:MAG TPA: hypothetical protein VMV57_07775, partial [Terracidiphilus sp.]|nr:hypothetical protein [Terracidiphilus sp.]